jgi:hypothetical protein
MPDPLSFRFQPARGGGEPLDGPQRHQEHGEIRLVLGLELGE